MKNIITLVLIAISVAIGNAQDPHFSQPLLSPVYLNPAFTGVMEGNLRLSILHRNQWFRFLDKHSYQTYGVAFDGRICGKTKNSWLGFGLKLLGDKAGFSIFERYQAQGTISGHVETVSNTYLSFGMEAGGLFYNVGYQDLRFDAQFDGENYIEGLPNMENFNNEQVRGKLDVSGGLMLFNPKQKWYLGLGVFHINTPDYVLVSSNVPSDSQVDIKWVVHAAYEPMITRKLSLSPKVIYQRQGQFWQLLAGIGTKMNIGSDRTKKQKFIINVAARLGGYVSNRLATYDALIVNPKFDLGRTTIGVSYDFNISSLRKASVYQGAFEIGISTELIREEKVKCVWCGL